MAMAPAQLTAAPTINDRDLTAPPFINIRKAKIMRRKPKQMPSIWGTDNLKPKLTPEAKSIRLFGPGVIDATKANNEKAINVSCDICFLTMFRPIRIRAGFTDFCPYNTPLQFVNHTP